MLGAMFDAAIDDGLLSVNPAKKKRTVNAPKSSQVRAQKPEIVTWTGDQLATFLAWNRDELKDELFPLWRLIAYTGMRRSEALALKWNDVNARTGRVSIRRAVNTEDWTTTKTTKTGNARVIDVDAATLKVLATYKVGRAEVSFELAKADAFVFGDDEGKLRSPDAMTSRWARRIKWITAKHASLPRVTIKGLRHTPRDTPARTRRAPQGRARTPRALHHHDHDEHLQPCHPDDAESRSRPLRGPSRRGLAHIPAHGMKMTPNLKN